MSSSFQPTQESIPPRVVKYRLRLPPNIPVHITPLNPLGFLLRAALVYPNKIALVHPDVPQPSFYTYSVWAQRVQNLAYALIERGIKPGDRVAVICPNAPMIADAHQGILAARAVITPINTRLTKDNVKYIVEHSGSKLILVDHELVGLTEGLGVPTIVSNDTGRAGDPYEEFLASGRRFSRERGWEGLDMEPDENVASCLCYTSGTTGKPKGVITTLRSSYLAAISNAYETKMGFDSIYLWLLPMFHAAGWTYPWANTFAFSTQVTTRAINYEKIWKHLSSGITHYCAAPTVQIGIVNAPQARRLEKPVQAIIAGAAPTAHLIGELEKVHIHVTHVYGLTETLGPFTRNYARPEWTFLTLDERSKLMARQGHSFANSDEARVVFQVPEGESGEDIELKDVPDDGKTLGEIVVRGNIVMKEYFRDPAATRKAFRGGHFASGDLAVRNSDGSLSISDRSKDLIISGGENASSLAIEQELSKFEDVLEVAVVGRSHHKWGERAMAFVILQSHSSYHPKERHADFEKKLKEFAKGKLPGFACPEWVRIVDELPKTSTGKIQKNVLRGVVAKL